MGTTRDQTFDELVRSIVGREPIKVWSWLITIFGDLTPAEDQEISGALLTALTERIGIRPEAMRVALHRLRKDGWIVARKEGRSSHYRLSDYGLVETRRASRRIYAAEGPRASAWHVVIVDPKNDRVASDLEDGHYLTISAHTFVGAGQGVSRDDGSLVLDVDKRALPKWIAQTALPAGVADGYTALASLLSEIESASMSDLSLGNLETAILRLLTLHHWRRTLLRHSECVEMICGEGWIGAECREQSQRLLQLFARPAVEQLALELT